jgi:predicted nucleic acid-binding protein
MWVAACCIRHQLPLVTLNQKDSVDFRQDGLELLEPPE